MKLRIDRDTLVESVHWVSRGLSGRPSLPILSGMLLECDDELHLSAYDYEISTRSTAVCEVSEPGRVLVHGQLFSEIVRNLPGDTLEISLDDPQIIIRSGSALFDLQTLPLEDYPALPSMPEPIGTVKTSVWTRAVSQVNLAASRDDSIPMLTGIWMECDHDTLTLVATDRYRIAVREVPWAPVASTPELCALTQARIISSLAKVMTGGPDVQLSFSGGEAQNSGTLGLKCGRQAATSSLLSDNYIPFRKHLPSDFSSRFQVETAPLLEAVKRVSLVAERSTPIRLTFEDHSVQLEAMTSGRARATDTLPAVTEGDDVSILFNPRYLLDGLTSLDGEITVLNCRGPLKPARLTSATKEGLDLADYLYVAMPIRV